MASTGGLEQAAKYSLMGEGIGYVRMEDGDVLYPRNGVDDDMAGLEDWLGSMANECDRSMSDVTEDIGNALGYGEGSNLVYQKLGFAALDREILTTLSASGSNQSTKNDTWSRRRFDEWRLQNGMSTSMPIETMNLKDLASLLPSFFQQVMKHNGDHYSLESLLGFYRGFTRIMRKAQEARICETRVIEIPFCMKSHPLFQQTGVAMLEAMRRSVLAGANKRRKKPTVVTWVSEEVMLADKDHQASHPYGCFRRWAYYCVSRFMIRSGKELYNVMDCDFQEGKDENGDYVVYGERLSRNQTSPPLPSSTPPVSVPFTKTGARNTIKRVKVEPVRVSVKCHQEDVRHTYRQFMKHQPVKVGDEVGNPRHLFLQPIGNPVTNAWFAKSHVSERVLISLFKTMAVVAGINVKDSSNKPGRPTFPIVSLGESSPMTSMRGSLASGLGLHVRYGTQVDVQAVTTLSILDQESDLPGGKRSFQEAFGDLSEKDNAEQHSSESSSMKSDPDQIPNAAGKAALEVLLDCGGGLTGAASFATTESGESISSKLQTARSQIKNLEVTLFDKINIEGAKATISSSGESVRDLVQDALLQLKVLESTLFSILSVP